MRSSRVKVNDTGLYLISIESGTFLLDGESRLTAALKAWVGQYSKVEYQISAAVFDAAGNLLGAAGHKEAVEYIRLGRWPIVAREIGLDFGVSKAFKDAAFVVVAISDRDVPKPG